MTSSKVARITAALGAATALVLAGLVYLGYIHQLGFPDGAVSELGRAQRRLAWVFVALSLGVAAVLVRLMSLKDGVARGVFHALLIQALLTLGAWAADAYLVMHLAGSAGG